MGQDKGGGSEEERRVEGKGVSGRGNSMYKDLESRELRELSEDWHGCALFTGEGQGPVQRRPMDLCSPNAH